MLFERKLSENELEQREAVIQGLLKNKRNLVKKYGKDAEKVMYGIATKKAKSKVESMNKEKIRELIYKALTKEDNDPSGENLEGDPGEHVEEGTCGYDRDIKGKKLKGPGGLSEDVDNFEVDNAIGELGDIIRDIDDKADEAREIVRQVFPNELSRLDAYGAFNMTYSNNRYDVTLGRFVERLEEEGYEIEDGEVYVNEDLDVGHVDDEPGMLKAELARAGKMIQMLYRAINKYDGKGEVDFPQWWQSKIIKANDYLDSAFDYLDGKENVAKIDAMIDMNEVSDANMVKGIEVIKQTLSKEGGAAGLEPLVKELVKLGFKKDEVVDLLKRMTTVKQHRDGDYILLPLEEKELSKNDEKSLKKIEKALKGSSKAHKLQADKIAKIVREKLTKRHDVGDFVDDFKKSKAKQFRGKSAKKKKEMAVAAYLAKQNDE